MRQLEVIGSGYEIPIQEEIEVKGSWPSTLPKAHTPMGTLDSKQRLQQHLWRERRRESANRIEKILLIGPPDRRASIQTGSGRYLGVRKPLQGGTRSTQQRAGISDIAAQPDECGRNS